MTKRHPTLAFLRSVLLATALAVALEHRADGNTTLLFQNFDSLPLQTSVSYSPPEPNAFTHVPPSGWIRDVSGVPGVGNPDVGVFEWEGWSFARKSFWNEVVGGRRREFLLGQGTVAVADTDEWNELGDPANTVGFYDTFLTTPLINFANSDTGARKFAFDSSWSGGCCDDGKFFDPKGNNQTAVIRLRFPNGSAVEILRWEAAPFVDIDGDPSTNPMDAPNPYFKPTATNEKVLIDLTPFLDQVTFTQARLEFSLTEAGDDGWWAFDTMHMFSLSLVPGDMNIDGIIDEADIPAFALGVQSVEAYRNSYFGEFPVTRGSPDSLFDFDDIPWFVSLLEGGGVGSAAEQVQAALGLAAPEPSSACLIAIGIAAAGPFRRRRARIAAR